MMNLLDLFEVEEQEVLNRTVTGEDLRKFSRQDVIMRLDFVLAINTDEDVRSLYEGLKSKLLNLTDGEWIKVRDRLPFDLFYSAEDEVPEAE